jgi:thiamine-monophosphate kinase
MIDVSDGLVADLGHIADCSGVGFELTDVPIADGATLQEALGGGDDYALAFTMPAGVDPAPNFSTAGLSLPRRLGICLKNPVHRLLAGKMLEPCGWEHPI